MELIGYSEMMKEFGYSYAYWSVLLKDLEPTGKKGLMHFYDKEMVQEAHTLYQEQVKKNREKGAKKTSETCKKKREELDNRYIGMWDGEPIYEEELINIPTYNHSYFTRIWGLFTLVFFMQALLAIGLLLK
ncbi:MAG: hypothetical protein CMI54_00380 [Parcubacteria group bacterium]|nr:hypothetical protein [Parcubacteria group bacterium]|tara:strand:- start:5448 stop:5840 length:393 start_codon:yes stop_codon:yes gene_type:complete